MHSVDDDDDNNKFYLISQKQRMIELYWIYLSLFLQLLDKARRSPQEISSFNPDHATAIGGLGVGLKGLPISQNPIHCFLFWKHITTTCYLSEQQSLRKLLIFSTCANWWWCYETNVLLVLSEICPYLLIVYTIDTRAVKVLLSHTSAWLAGLSSLTLVFNSLVIF